MADEGVVIPANVTGNAEDKLDRIAKAVENLSSTSDKGFKQAAKSSDIFFGSLAADVAVRGLEKVVAVAEKLFDTFVVEGVKAASEAQAATQRLNFALAQAGEFSEENVSKFEAFAEELSKTTQFEDDAIKSNAAFIESLGQLSEEGLESATLAAANLAAALGISLEEATRKLTLAASGSAEAIKGTGLQFDQGTTQAESFANAVEAVNNQFGGAAAANVSTFAGAIKQNENSFKQLQQAIGSVIVENPVIIELIKNETAERNKLIAKIIENKEEIKSFIAEGILSAIDAVGLFIAVLQALERVGRVTFAGLSSFAKASISGFTALSQAISGNVGGAFDTLKSGAKDASKTIDDGLNNGSALDGVNDRLIKMREVAATAFDAMKNGADGTVDPINRAAGAVENLTAEELRLIDIAKKFLESTKGADPAKEFEDRKNGLILLEEQYDISEQSINEALFRAADERDRKEAEINQKRIDQYAKAIEDLKTIDEFGNAELIAQHKEALAEIGNNENLSIEQRAAAQRKLTDLQKAEESSRLGAISDTFGQIASVTGKNTVAYKAAAIAQATIATYTGASQAAAAVAGIIPIGPFLAPIVAAAFIGAGLARVAQIASTPLATGIDSVPGTGTRDNFPAILAPGERVVPTKTNRDLTSFLDGGNNRDVLEAILNRLGQLQNQIVVNVGNKEIINEVRQGLASGRTFA